MSRYGLKWESHSCSAQAWTNAQTHLTYIIVTSVTRLGDLLDFGKLFKPCGNI